MPSVTCIYGRGPFLTGQRLAAELLIDGLRARGWKVTVIATPVLNRGSTNGTRARLPGPDMAWRLITAWVRGILAAFGRQPLYVNVGQTSFALVRDGLPVLIRSFLGREGPIVLSLHGNFFTEWESGDSRARLLQRLARAACRVTVLGNAQRRSLARLGIAEHKIVIMDNTCLVTPLTDEECERKQAAGEDPIRVLFLSNLMEDKGYPEFLDAIGMLAATYEQPLHAVLCGTTLDIGRGERFETPRAAAEWIRRRCGEINTSRSVRIEWLSGAQGQEKQDLMRGAHILAFTSKKEAQPIVVLEALASGCALITTNVGMIPETVDAETAILLDPGEPKRLAEAIMLLADEPERRARLARQGLQLFRRRFTYEQHLERWERLLITADTRHARPESPRP